VVDGGIDSLYFLRIIPSFSIICTFIQAGRVLREGRAKLTGEDDLLMESVAGMEEGTHGPVEQSPSSVHMYPE